MLTSPEYWAYRKELLIKKCSVCQLNSGTKDFPNCEKNKSWPKFGICVYLKDDIEFLKG